MKNKLVKRILAGVIAAAVVCAAAAGGWKYHRNNRTAPVYAVSSLTDSYWGDEVYSSGQVTNDYSQNVYVSRNDTVNEIFVEEGQQVKIGDALLELDTRTAELEYNMKLLDVENLQHQLDLAEYELKKWKNMKPGTSLSSGSVSSGPYGAGGLQGTGVRMSASAGVVPAESDAASGTALLSASPEKTGEAYNYILPSAVPYNSREADGSAENPYRYLCTKDAWVSGAAIRSYAEQKICVVLEVYENNTVSGDGLQSEWTIDGTTVAIPEDSTRWSVVSRTQIASSDPGEDSGKTDDNDPQDTKPDDTKPDDTKPDDTKPDDTKPDDAKPDPDGQHETDPDEGSFDESDADPVAEPENDVFPDDMSIDDFSADDVYTKEEIAEQLEEAEKKVRELDLSRRKAELEVKKLEAKRTDGTIRSTVNGVVKNLQDPEDRDSDTEPLLTVSGSEGLYVTGALSELLLDQVGPGQTVTVNSWESGTSCEAEITEILDYPAAGQSYYGGDGNSNVSYYPYVAYIEDTTGLRNGEYVDLTMTIGGGGGEDTIYLPKAYVRSDSGTSYVYKADENDRLVKQPVKTGRTIWGMSVEIKTGLTMDDRIAFPYGKTAKEGIRTVDSEVEY